jgi:excinuclease ABC subunit B
MAEDLTDYLQELGIKVRWLHSDIAALERVELLRDLRVGAFDVLVGVNLLREGLDLPEVSLVCIMEADKEGFLRAERSLIQTIGRAARNVGGQVILYAQKVTDSMDRALKETNRRREIQITYNLENDITPQTIVKETTNALLESLRGKAEPSSSISEKHIQDITSPGDLSKVIKKLENQMRAAAKNLDFEKASALRDQLKVLQELKQKGPKVR